jgi:phenylpropionate dioxygenase-like ring-hydroxylating dioxygenase large terminal subunit
VRAQRYFATFPSAPSCSPCQRRSFDTVFEASLFKDYWHLICHRKEVPAAGDYLRLDTPVGDLVIFNDAGDIMAFDNLCPHRGARMFSGSAGRQAATCKYHGWSYNRGRVIVPVTAPS